MEEKYLYLDNYEEHFLNISEFIEEAKNIFDYNIKKVVTEYHRGSNYNSLCKSLKLSTKGLLKKDKEDAINILIQSETDEKNKEKLLNEFQQVKSTSEDSLNKANSNSMELAELYRRKMRFFKGTVLNGIYDDKNRMKKEIAKISKEISKLEKQLKSEDKDSESLKTKIEALNNKKKDFEEKYVEAVAKFKDFMKKIRLLNKNRGIFMEYTNDNGLNGFSKDEYNEYYSKKSKTLKATKGTEKGTQDGKGKDDTGKGTQDGKCKDNTGKGTQDGKGKDNTGKGTQDGKGKDDIGKDTQDGKCKDDTGKDTQDGKGKDNTGKGTQDGKGKDDIGKGTQDGKGKDGTEKGTQDGKGKNDDSGNAKNDSSQQSNDRLPISIDINESDSKIVEKYVKMSIEERQEVMNNGELFAIITAALANRKVCLVPSKVDLLQSNINYDSNVLCKNIKSNDESGDRHFSVENIFNAVGIKFDENLYSKMYGTKLRSKLAGKIVSGEIGNKPNLIYSLKSLKADQISTLTTVIKEFYIGVASGRINDEKLIQEFKTYIDNPLKQGMINSYCDGYFRKLDFKGYLDNLFSRKQRRIIGLRTFYSKSGNLDPAVDSKFKDDLNSKVETPDNIKKNDMDRKMQDPVIENSSEKDKLPIDPNKR